MGRDGDNLEMLGGFKHPKNPETMFVNFLIENPGYDIQVISEDFYNRIRIIISKGQNHYNHFISWTDIDRIGKEDLDRTFENILKRGKKEVEKLLLEEE